MPDFVKFSEAFSIALHALSYLSNNSDRVVSSLEISRSLGISENHLSKVLQRLSRAGILDSTRGPRGGFRLHPTRRRLKLIEVYESIEGRVSGPRCLLSPSVCKGARCKIGAFVKDTDEAAIRILKETFLAEMAKTFGENFRQAKASSKV